jgi:hypothetical protein
VGRRTGHAMLLPGMIALGLAAFGLMLAFIELCDRV